MLNIDVAYDPAVQILGIHGRGNICPHKTYTWVFIVALFIIAKKCVWGGNVHQPMSRMNVHQPMNISMEYYLSIKRNEALIHVMI